MLELNNIEYNRMKNDQCLETWIITLPRRFQTPISIALGFLSNKKSLLQDFCYCQPFA